MKNNTKRKIVIPPAKNMMKKVANVNLSPCVSRKMKNKDNPYSKYIDDFEYDKKFGRVRLNIRACVHKYDQDGHELYSMLVQHEIHKDLHDYNTIAKCYDNAIGYLSEQIAEHEQTIRDMKEMIDFLAESMLGNGELADEIEEYSKFDTRDLFDDSFPKDEGAYVENNNDDLLQEILEQINQEDGKN